MAGLVLREHLRAVAVETELRRNVRGRAVVVAREHDDAADAAFAKRLDGVDCFRTDRILNA